MAHLTFILISALMAAASYIKERKILSPFFLLSLAAPLLLLISPSFAYLAGGMIFLIHAADFLTEGASEIAVKMGVPPLVTGILIIGLGTSMPELFVNVLSALSGSTDLALGNILGSNVANMGLVIGAGGLIAGTITIKKGLISKEVPIMLGATILMVLLAWELPINGGSSTQWLSFNDGLIFLLGLFFYLLYMFQSFRSKDEPEDVQQMFEEHYEEDNQSTMKGFHLILMSLVGIVGLYFGGDFIIIGGLDIATTLGAGTMALGIIVGVGTSLPELAAAVSAARKGETDLIVGNVVGSNIFNILLVLGCTALITPIQTQQNLLIHFAMVLGMSFLFFIIMGSRKRINRLESVLLTLGGIGYLVYGVI